jgi:hypothetical protein
LDFKKLNLSIQKINPLFLKKREIFPTNFFLFHFVFPPFGEKIFSFPFICLGSLFLGTAILEKT